MWAGDFLCLNVFPVRYSYLLCISIRSSYECTNKGNIRIALGNGFGLDSFHITKK